MEHAIRNPPVLTFEWHPTGRDTLILTAGSGRNRLTIVASRQRFEQAIMNPTASRADVARGMYERDEIDLASFEAALEP